MTKGALLFLMMSLYT